MCQNLPKTEGNDYQLCTTMDLLAGGGAFSVAVNLGWINNYKENIISYESQDDNTPGVAICCNT